MFFEFYFGCVRTSGKVTWAWLHVFQGSANMWPVFVTLVAGCSGICEHALQFRVHGCRSEHEMGTFYVLEMPWLQHQAKTCNHMYYSGYDVPTLTQILQPCTSQTTVCSHITVLHATKGHLQSYLFPFQDAVCHQGAPAEALVPISRCSLPPSSV